MNGAMSYVEGISNGGDTKPSSLSALRMSDDGYMMSSSALATMPPNGSDRRSVLSDDQSYDARSLRHDSFDHYSSPC
jgi:hypothetical protein